MGNFKVSRKDKEWLVERCGELLVKVFKSNISKVFDEVSRWYPDVSRKEINSAFRTANPNSCQYAKKTYNPLYEQGAEKNNLETTENNRVLGYLEIDRQTKLQQVREAISGAIVEGPISVVDSLGRISTINPKLLDIFDKNHELSEARNQSGSDGRDQGDELGQFDAAAQLALPRPGSEEDGE